MTVRELLELCKKVPEKELDSKLVIFLEDAEGGEGFEVRLAEKYCSHYGETIYSLVILQKGVNEKEWENNRDKEVPWDEDMWLEED